ncbi:hypothetical protein Back2_28760 [Nocardioides baekrokdamisoli]|uniref:Blue (type 1) copper domain-containing protein n=1 Tax=Nocardioides baekrokdamisoli TaxID=1804624 RepID=A0A3G9J6E5_9ACTN|nr:plastocyanin/azurin family copper-binding protein [Nocardioides baekrokdamisoli]BBH18589.1 hypothetical protein Back2_28760 [Nocardioides baekrokdamisoli]
MTKTRLYVRAALVAVVTCVTAMFGSLVLLQEASSAAGASVAIQNFAYSPQVVTITVGSTVTWTNDDGTDHTVTSLSGPGAFDSGQIASGGTYSHRFTVVGTYTYHCADHSMMPTATVRVVPATTPSPHPTTHPTVRSSPHVTPSPPHPAPIPFATHAASPSMTPMVTPTKHVSASTTASAKPHVSTSASVGPTAGSPATGGGNGSPHAALWWIGGAVLMVGGGTAIFLRRSRRS